MDVLIYSTLLSIYSIVVNIFPRYHKNVVMLCVLDPSGFKEQWMNATLFTHGKTHIHIQVTKLQTQFKILPTLKITKEY
jgi:hypothetical protein